MPLDWADGCGKGKYKPRDQQSTLLHKVVLENLETFLAEARLRDPNGQGVPDFVEHELRKFLECGHLLRVGREPCRAR
jgi:hypothetical protein